MKQIAYIISAGTLISTLVLACSDDSSGGGGTFAGQGGDNAGGTTSAAGKAGTSNNTAGKSGSGNTTGGAGGDTNTFGGGGDTQGGSDQGGSDQGGAGGAAGDDCETCLTNSCDNEVKACDANAECAAIFQCFGMCPDGDNACLQKCVTDHPNGTADFQAFQKCGVDNCKDACSGGGGGGDVKCTNVKVSEKEACNTCIHTSCCSELEGCANNNDCISLNNCLVQNNCMDQTCAQMCAQANPGGVASFNTFSMCLQSSCMSDCQ